MNLPKGLPPSRRPDSRPFIGSAKLPNPAVAAQAVHRAVCEITGSDGFGHCYLYANLGWMLLLQLGAHSHEFSCNAGSLYLKPNPADENQVFAFEADDDAIARGEFHAWIVGVDGPTLIDFSSRHYPRYALETDTAEGGRTGLVWGRPDPPRYIWDRPDRMPRWATFRTVPAACHAMGERLWRDNDDFREHRMRTLAIYRQMT